VTPTPPLLFVTVGTDHHPFHRLVTWVDAWLAEQDPNKVRCLVQTGTSRPPDRADHVDFLPYQQMQQTIEAAAMLVCHGGPGSIMLCRWLGKRPIVVPRRRELGEHVDDHQVVFSRRMAANGELELAEDEHTFSSLLTAALAGRLPVDVGAGGPSIMDAVLEFERLVDGVMRR
jgi:UDP-N-acetylglucosamine transferase subunit ALG13